jgi:hypothetical protein
MMRFVVGSALAIASAQIFAQAVSCNSAVDAVAPFTQISLRGNISPIFESNCASCHIGGGQSGGLNLDFLNIMSQLLNVPSPQNSAFRRVVPGDVNASLLFQKVNCEQPEVGSQMPLGRDPLSVAQQRIIRDWIALGAPLMRGGFEDR